MSTEAQSTQYMQILVGDGATPTEGFDAIPQALDLDGPSEEATETDVTNYDSDVVETKKSMRNAPDISFSIFWKPDEELHQQLLADAAADGEVKRNYQVKHPGEGALWLGFEAWVKSFKWGNPVNGVTKADIVLRRTSVCTAVTE